jgi:hypothetical protein
MMTAISMFAFNIIIANAEANVVRPHKPGDSFTVEVSYSTPNLTITVSGGGEGSFEYQYWIKAKVSTDTTPLNVSANDFKFQYVWKLIGAGFTGVNYAEVEVDDNYKDEDGNYNVIVRVKDNSILEGNGIVEELYGVYTPADAGEPVISAVIVDGKIFKDDYIIVNKGSEIDMSIVANMSGLTYNLKGFGNTLTNSTGVFSLNFNSNSSIKTGLNIFEIEALIGENIAKKTIKFYVLDSYISNQMPVIESLVGTPNDGDGDTIFTMKVRYADGSSITDVDKDKFNYKLISGKITGRITRTELVGGYVEVDFNVDYKGAYGIYETIATVSRSASTQDDKAIIYYDGFTRPASIKLAGNTTASVGQPVFIEVTDVNFDDATGDIEYAFYREDASGWVLMRQYSTIPSMTWTPVRAGKYVIQVRMKDSDAGSYEATATKEYTIGSMGISGSLSLEIYDYATDDIAENIIAGKPYKLFAKYTGTEDMLYMFTLSSNNLGTVYLNKFNPSPYLMFVPNKSDSFKITARAINAANFGCKDITTEANINPSLELILKLTTTEYVVSFNDGSFTIPEDDITFIGGAGNITLDYTVYYGAQKLTITDGTFDFVGTGVYDITVTASCANGEVSQDMSLTVIDNVIDMEQSYQLVQVGTTNGDNAFSINRITYASSGITAPAGYGSYGLKLSNVNGSEYPEIHFKFLDTYPSGSQIQFDYYVQNASDFSWNYKNPNNGQNLGDISGNRTGNVGKWIHGYQSFDFSSNEVWLWIYLVAGNLYNVNIYIDNIVVNESPAALDFERDYQLGCVYTPATNEGVGYQVLSYATAGINPWVTGSGDKVLKLTNIHNSSWPEIRFKLSKTYPAGSTLRFDYYVTNVTDFEWNYKQPNVASKGPINGNPKGPVGTWIHGYQTMDFSFNEVWLWCAHDNTNIVMYIDNVEIVENYQFAGLTFENENDVKQISTTLNDNAFTIERVSYTQAGISRATNGGDYLVKLTPTNSEYPEVHISTIGQFAPGTQVFFDYYVTGNLWGFEWHYKNAPALPDAGTITNNKNGDFNTWITGSHTFTSGYNQIWLWCYVGYIGKPSNVTIYIDNIRIVQP